MPIEIGYRQYQKERLYANFKRYTDPETCKMVHYEVKSRKQEDLSCPHCRSRQVVRYGKYRDRQRYKCKNCSRTFNDYTNTPLHRTHFPLKWIKFLQCMLEGLSLRMAAASVGVTYVTLFYWRHKLIHILHLLEKSNPSSKMAPLSVKRKVIALQHGVPLQGLFALEIGPFIQWIRPFIRIATKYWWRYVSWFRFIEKESEEKELAAMTKMLITACSIPLEQTYSSLSQPS